MKGRLNNSILLLLWGLISIATLIVGGLAMRSIRYERERYEQSLRNSENKAIRHQAQLMRNTVSDTRDELLEELSTFADDLEPEQLRIWAQNQPLVNQEFIWNQERGLMHPVRIRFPGHRGSRFSFHNRYRALFSGSVPWQLPIEEPGKLDAGSSLDLGKRPQRSRNTRIAERPAPESGWIPWTDNNRLHYLGWVRANDGKTVYGIELETMLLLSRLVALLPDDQGGCSALLDSSGQIFFQKGIHALNTDTEHLLRVSLAPELPQWELAVNPPMAAGGAAIPSLTFLLIATSTGIILIGGFLMQRWARSAAREATQKTSFVANVSHELKTPLTSLLMYAELLADERTTAPEKKQRYLQIITDESRRLTRLVNNVLDFGRLEQGRKNYRIERMELNAATEEILFRHTPRIETSGMKLQLDMAKQPLFINADRDALEQVLINLVENAIKYASKGGELFIKTEQNNGASLHLCDRGPGIPRRARNKIFNKFYRVDDSLTAEQSGSGLGLSIAHELMIGQHAQISFQSRAGGGACFTLQFPEVPHE